MAEQWVPIYRSSETYEVQFILNLLKEEEIPAVTVNKQVSMHVHLNEQAAIEVHVRSQDVIRSKFIIEKSNQ
jgi:hypothetical protein